MSWTKIGAEFPDEAGALSDAAFRTHVEALCWSNRRLADLLIPKSAVRKFAETDTPELAIKELLAGGWWEDRGDAWYVGCRFPEWQRDRVQVEHQRVQNAERQMRRRRHLLDDHSLCLPEARCQSRPRDRPGDSSRESPRDAARESRRAPERNGTERRLEANADQDGVTVAQFWEKTARGYDS